MSDVVVYALRRAVAMALLLTILAGLLPPLQADPPPLRWRWSNPTPHGGNIADLAFGFGLTVAVAERGQIYTSEDLQFWEPRSSGTDRDLRAAAFFGSRLLVTGQAGTVLYADSLDDFQLVNLDTADWLEAVAVSSQWAVAVGDNGAIYTSPDGARWHRQHPPFNQWLRGLACGNGTFVAVGENGLIATSTDTTNWTTQTSGTSRHLNRVTWVNSQFWVLGDEGLSLKGSPDGQTWTPFYTGATNALFALACSSNTCVVVGENEVRRQFRTGAWSDDIAQTHSYSAPAWTYSSAIWEQGLFLIAGRSGMLVQGFTTNGPNSFLWLPRSRPIRNWLWELQRTPDFYVTVGFGGTILTSENGINWHLELVPDSATNSTLLGVGGNTNLLLAVGQQGTVLLSPNVTTNTVLTNANGSLLTNQASTLGIFWHALSPPPTTNHLQGVACRDQFFVLTGSRGSVLTSPDGTNWTTATTPTSAFLSSVAPHPDGWVAVGQSGTILSSLNARSWSLAPSDTTNWIYRVRYLGGQLIAVGENGTILTSTNGQNWTRQNSGTSRWLNDVVLLDNTYFVAGNQGAILASSDTRSWTNLGCITAKSLCGLAQYQGQLLAAGTEGAILRSQVSPILDPVRFHSFSRRDNYNLYWLTGRPDQRCRLDRTGDWHQWLAGPTLEFLEGSSTVLFLENTGSNAPPSQFYRAVLLP